MRILAPWAAIADGLCAQAARSSPATESTDASWKGQCGRRVARVTAVPGAVRFASNTDTLRDTPRNRRLHLARQLLVVDTQVDVARGLHQVGISVGTQCWHGMPRHDHCNARRSLRQMAIPLPGPNRWAMCANGFLARLTAAGNVGMPGQCLVVRRMLLHRSHCSAAAAPLRAQSSATSATLAEHADPKTERQCHKQFRNHRKSKKT